MGDGPITFADGVVLSILVLSGIFALVRGFTREVLTIAAWGISAIILIVAYEPLQMWAREAVLDGLITDIVVASFLFLVPLVGLSFASHSACKTISESGVSVVDRILGFGFGIARGLAAVIIVYWMYSLVEDPSDHPRWIERAKLFPMVEASAEYLDDWLPQVASDPVRPRFALIAENAGDKNEDDTLPRSGYVRSDRTAIERLVLASEARDDD